MQQQLEEAAAKHQTVLEAVKEGEFVSHQIRRPTQSSSTRSFLFLRGSQGEDPRDLRFAPVMNFKKGTDGWEDLKNCCVCKEKLKRKMQVSFAFHPWLPVSGLRWRCPWFTAFPSWVAHHLCSANSVASTPVKLRVELSL